MKLILHIGCEKTGTSSLQAFLHRNQKALADSGIHYLHFAHTPNYEPLALSFVHHEHLNQYLADKGLDATYSADSFRSHVQDQFRHQAASIAKNQNGCAIVSSEHFHSRIRTKEDYLRVHAFFADIFSSVDIICYIRAQAEVCQSSYCTYLKSGGQLSFKEFGQRCRPGVHYYNYDQMLRGWEERYGRENIKVRLFKKNSFHNHNLLDDFLHHCGIKAVHRLPQKAKHYNVSVDRLGLRLLRRVNQILAPYRRNSSIYHVHQWVRQAISILFKGSPDIVSDTLRRKIEANFTPSNEAVRKRYFSDREALFQAPSLDR